MEVGSAVNVNYEAVYEYDNTPFNGQVVFQDISSESIGAQEYGVLEIVDDQHGLSSFKYNQISIIFDGITVMQSIQFMVPYSIRVDTELLYKSDNAPVHNALVVVNGKNCIENDGKYTTIINTLSPMTNVMSEIDVGGFTSRINEDNIILMGNIMLMGFVVVAAYAIFRMFNSRKNEVITRTQ